jgi:membrane-bound lytic murein transglycosylase C
VSDDTARKYCGVAAYNTGPGNLARALVDEANISRATNVANGMTSQELYDLLQRNLPAEETRSYLRKVRKRQGPYDRCLNRRSCD